MKHLSQQIVTKKSGIDLGIEISMGGKTIIKRQADSLVGNFARVLAGMIGDNQSSDDGRRVLSIGNIKEGEIGEGIESIDYTSPPTIDWNYGFDYPFGGGYQALRLITNNDTISGLYYGVGGNNTDLYNISYDRSAGTFTKEGAADWSSISDSSWNGKFTRTIPKYVKPSRPGRHFQHPNIIVGENSSGKSVEIEDWKLEDRIKRLDTTDTNISTPAVSTNSSEITLSRTFTNNTLNSFNVAEVGVVGRGGEVLLARDAVSSFTIDPGVSVTIDYVFEITNDSGGGVMSNFHQQLYREFAKTDRTVKDREGNDQNDRHNNATQWMAGGPGGDTYFAHSDSPGVLGQYFGPAVGSDFTSVSNTNDSLLGQIPHGSQDGQLFYYGTSVEPVVTDTTNGEVYFDISRMIENRGSTSVTILETGLYTAYGKIGLPNLKYSTLMCRHVQPTSVTVDPGEVLKLSYRIKVVV